MQDSNTGKSTRLKPKEMPEIDLTRDVVDEICNEIINGCSVKLALMRVSPYSSQTIFTSSVVTGTPSDHFKPSRIVMARP